jgi:hypothetical protein
MGVLVRELVAKLVSLIPLRLYFATTSSSIPRKRSTCLLLRCAMRKWICAFVWRLKISWIAAKSPVFSLITLPFWLIGLSIFLVVHSTWKTVVNILVAGNLYRFYIRVS